MRKLVQSQTAARLKKLDAQLRRSVLKPGSGKREDADSIHDLRVSTRRLAQELKVFQGWFEAGHVKRIRRRLRKLMEHCAAVRNCDVAIEVLRAAGWRNPELFAALGKERRRTRQELARKLASWRRRDRTRRWREQLRVAKPVASADLQGKAGPTAAGLLPAMMEDLFRAGGEAARPDSSRQRMHQFRLKTKRVRYTLELFQPVYGRKTQQIMESLKGLQEKLGAINDCATTLEMIRGNRAAAAAVRRLTGERETAFRRYWKRRFGPEETVRWKAVLSTADGKD